MNLCRCHRLVRLWILYVLKWNIFLFLFVKCSRLGKCFEYIGKLRRSATASFSWEDKYIYTNTLSSTCNIYISENDTKEQQTPMVWNIVFVLLEMKCLECFLSIQIFTSLKITHTFKSLASRIHKYIHTILPSKSSEYAMSTLLILRYTVFTVFLWAW